MFAAIAPSLFTSAPRESLRLLKRILDDTCNATYAFSCICTPRYYYDQLLLNRPDFWLF